MWIDWKTDRWSQFSEIFRNENFSGITGVFQNKSVIPE
jgi:hypothetical protein